MGKSFCWPERVGPRSLFQPDPNIEMGGRSGGRGHELKREFENAMREGGRGKWDGTTLVPLRMAALSFSLCRFNPNQVIIPGFLSFCRS